MTLAYVALGSNLAHPRRQLARAVAALSRLPQSRVVAVSRNYATAPVGVDEAQPDYVNAVAVLDTALAPRALLARLNAVERRQHRRRGAGAPRNAPRTLDLDLLLYGRRRIDVPHLMVPHPRMHERSFVLRSRTSRRRWSFPAAAWPDATGATYTASASHGPARIISTSALAWK